MGGTQAVFSISLVFFFFLWMSTHVECISRWLSCRDFWTWLCVSRETRACASIPKRWQALRLLYQELAEFCPAETLRRHIHVVGDALLLRKKQSSTRYMVSTLLSMYSDACPSTDILYAHVLKFEVINPECAFLLKLCLLRRKTQSSPRFAPYDIVQLLSMFSKPRMQQHCSRQHSLLCLDVRLCQAIGVLPDTRVLGRHVTHKRTASLPVLCKECSALVASIVCGLHAPLYVDVPTGLVHIIKRKAVFDTETHAKRAKVQISV